MLKTPMLWACGTAMLLLSPVPVLAAESAPQAAESDIDPAAMAALDRMGTALRSHKAFVVKSEVTSEEVMDDGEKLQYAGTVEIQAQRPDRFKIAAVSDIKNREFYYDGKSLTIFSPKLGLYAAFAAPPTIAQTVAKASEEYDIEFPLADLFSWGTDKAVMARIKSAFLVRPEHIGGQLCDHYAFRQEQVDWQIWIAEDASALPCKLVITDKSDPSLPQYVSVMHWSFPDSIANSAFAFVPSSSAHKIVIAKLTEEPAKGSKP